MGDGNDKEYECDDKVCEHNILLGGYREVLIEVVDVGDLVGQVNPFEPVQEYNAEEDNERVGDDLSDCELVQLVDQQNFSPYRNLALGVGRVRVEVRKVLLLLPVDEEVVGDSAEVVDEQEDGEQHEAELQIEDDHEGVIVAHPLGDSVGQQQVNGLLELVEAEAICADSEEPDPEGDSPVANGLEHEDEDDFEHDVGVILVVVRVVLHVLVEADDEPHQHHHVEHNEGRSHHDVDCVCARRCNYLGAILLLQAQVWHLQGRTRLKCHGY